MESTSNETHSYTTKKPTIKPPPAPKQTLSNSTAIFNNNVCVALGSGVESINKRLNSTKNNYTQSFKPSTGVGGNTAGVASTKYSNGSNYSQVDSKNLKLIKTDNGLVYTPIISSANYLGNKSNDALVMAQDEEEDDDEHDYQEEDAQIEELNEEDDQPRHQQRQTNNYSNGKPANAYNSVKKAGNAASPHNPVSKVANSHFQNELSIRLKSINSDKETKPNTASIHVANNASAHNTNADMIYSKNYAINVNGAALKITASNNSTATTSISSASSCASNSDLIISTSSASNSSKRGVTPPSANELVILDFWSTYRYT